MPKCRIIYNDWKIYIVSPTGRQRILNLIRLTKDEWDDMIVLILFAFWVKDGYLNLEPRQMKIISDRSWSPPDITNKIADSYERRLINSGGNYRTKTKDSYYKR